MVKFQSTHPRRVWRLILLLSLVRLLFQSTHPRRVWLLKSARALGESWFQSTHPRRVWHFALGNISSGQAVSIHTPTKGVTFVRLMLMLHLVFQSTHPRRVWLSNKVVLKLTICFNPHTHEGCDLYYDIFIWNSVGFNPHTHEGCDILLVPSPLNVEEFQSTHPRRVWPARCQVSLSNSMFQSTHPRRVWRKYILFNLSVKGFNPHTHEGCDVGHISSRHRTDFVSIHTPTKGVTPLQTAAFTRLRVSIHTPTKGVTLHSRFFGQTLAVSIHTPTKGVTTSFQL